MCISPPHLAFVLHTRAAVFFLSHQCLRQYVQLAIMEGGGAPITCPDMACQKSGVLLDSEVCPDKKAHMYSGSQPQEPADTVKHTHSDESQGKGTLGYSTFKMRGGDLIGSFLVF